MREIESARALEASEVEYVPPVTKEEWYAFIASTRFWVMVLGTLSVYLESKGWIGEPERNLIASLAAIFITVRTIDRAAERV